jgi:integrase/recombinase XerC/integrase/recombinase XerD
MLLLDTGIRVSELTAIKLTDVFDLEHMDIRERIKINGEGNKERFVRMSPSTQKAILSYLLKRGREPDCLWVSQTGQPLRSRGVQFVIQRTGERIGLSGVRCSPHTFRHTFATTALTYGAGEFEVQSLLGHESLTMTRCDLTPWSDTSYNLI